MNETVPLLNKSMIQSKITQEKGYGKGGVSPSKINKSLYTVNNSVNISNINDSIIPGQKNKQSKSLIKDMKFEADKNTLDSFDYSPKKEKFNTNESIYNNSSGIYMQNSSIFKGNSSNDKFTASNIYNSSINGKLESAIIKMNTEYSSLKNELDIIADLQGTNSKNSSKISNKTNILSINYFNKRRKGYGLFKSPINAFNSKILTNTDWGNKRTEGNKVQNQNVINPVIGKHRTKHQELQELGFNIIQTLKMKMPRKRKVDLLIK